MESSVIENCCVAVALVSHFWMVAKPVKRKKAYKVVAIQHEIQDLRIPDLVLLQKVLQVGTTASFAGTLPVPLPPPNLPEKPRWDSWGKGLLSLNIPDLAGGQGLGWNAGAGWSIEASMGIVYVGAVTKSHLALWLLWLLFFLVIVGQSYSNIPPGSGVSVH